MNDYFQFSLLILWLKFLIVLNLKIRRSPVLLSQHVTTTASENRMRIWCGWHRVAA